MDTSTISTDNVASAIETFVQSQELKRKSFERRWYDNNFFDDGYHFRFVSRTTGKIIDLSTSKQTLGPNRSIPKASRQIRGVVNLLMGPEWVPVIYPQKINPNNYKTVIDPKTQKEVPGPDYDAAMKFVKTKAQNIGHWITEEWKKQELEDKVTLALILAAKNGVSYIQVWPDDMTQKIESQVYDAFDVYADGTLTDFEDNTMIVKAIPKSIYKIKANESFDHDQLKKINPDNRYASSEIKEAYMRSRFGRGYPSDITATLIQKEAYIKEYVSEENRDQIISDLGSRADEFKRGDVIIRQVFEAGGVWLSDKYTSLRKYPLVPYRFEPGPLYQVPLIERFMPANKSLDTAMSRVERWMNTMVSGGWMKRKGENFEITNKAGGNVYEWEQSKPEQVDIQPLPQAVWNFIKELNDIIEEQGASTSALAQIPEGLRSGVAIESIKSTEYSNLKIPTKQLKTFIQEITERMIDIASHHFIKPQDVNILDANNEFNYFEVIGEEGVLAHNKIGETIDEKKTTVIDFDTIVNIETESGMGFTVQGERETMMQIAEYMLKVAEQGLIPQQAVQVAVKKLLETFQFGSTQEFMQAIEDGTVDMTDTQIQQIKLAVAETLKDTGAVGPQASQQRQMENKVGVLEALKESGLADKINTSGVQDNPELAPIPYKDAPEDIKRQMEVNAGLKPSKGVSPAGVKQLADLKDSQSKAKIAEKPTPTSS